MAFSAHQDARMLEELSDSPADVARKAEEVAQLIRGANRVVFFTGAGISTAAGIADYRGPQGVWTLSAQGREREIRSKDMLCAVPTATHMAIAVLLKRQLAHCVISQNVDGLHRKSGVERDQICELHGNCNLEYCQQCMREYLRDFQVQGLAARSTHATGRRCVAPGCGGALHDTIINFGEGLPPDLLAKGFAQSEHADLHIVLGSSLTVAPANDMPRATKRAGGKLVIVNLQRTPQDASADVRVHAPVNDFMQQVMAHLALDIPPFRLRRGAAVWRGEGGIACAGVDPADGAPQTLFRRCAVNGGRPAEGSPERLILASGEPVDGEARVRCEFYGHYEEPPVELVLPEGCPCRHFTLTFDPLSDAAWTVEHADGAPPPSLDTIRKGPGGAATAERARASQAPRAEPDFVDTTDYSGWHAVQPADTCPHCPTSIKSAEGVCVDLHAPCQTCGNKGENMLCLACHAVHCGRHVQQHMLAHHAATGHPIVCGFIDLSFWCYECDTYIAPGNPKLAPYYVALHTAKFGVPPPRGVLGVAVTGGA
eukprot:TRINITY_DN316_c0_g1_i1.p1 TRINITY_DN316_c0_g1~~TRINITY_DN316_c0_g1_i1.p1  ORF type:complete len:570 (+),score=213.77 TRINITY_DN316_c0_g1_i1:88-1710(+)